MSAYRDERVYRDVDRAEVEAWVNRVHDGDDDVLRDWIVGLIVTVERREPRSDYDSRPGLLTHAVERDAVGRALYEHLAGLRTPWGALTKRRRRRWWDAASTAITAQREVSVLGPFPHPEQEGDSPIK